VKAIFALFLVACAAPAPRSPSTPTDEALFWSAQTSLKEGRTNEARPLLVQVVDARGRFADAARVSLGDLDFDRGEYKLALDEYAAVSSARLAGYASYRSAWCELQLGEAAMAIPTFVSLAHGEPGKLADAARKDLAYAFAQASPEGPTSFDDARMTLLTAANGDRERAAAIGEAIAHEYCAAGLIDACLASYRELAPRDCPTIDVTMPGDALVHGAETATPACRARIGDAIGAIAMQRHRDGDASAELLYAAYLDQFGDIPAVVYFAGELAYARGDFCAAAPRYARYVQTHDGEHRDEAAYAHVLATLECQHLRDVTPPSTDATEPQPVPPPWQHVLAATELYLATTKTPDPAVAFLHARILYGFAHLADAIAALRPLAHGTDELARNAAVLLREAEHRVR
jgi:hypothetical protein